MSGEDYNNATVIFFVSYVGMSRSSLLFQTSANRRLSLAIVAFEVPSNLVLKKVSLAAY